MSNPNKPEPASETEYVRCYDCGEVFDAKGRELADDSWQPICDCGSSDNIGCDGLSDAEERRAERQAMGITC